MSPDYYTLGIGAGRKRRRMVSPATPPAIISRADDMAPLKGWQIANARRIFVVQRTVSQKPYKTPTKDGRTHQRIPLEAGLVVVEHECNFDFTACNKRTGASGPYQIVSPSAWNTTRLGTYDLVKSSEAVYSTWDLWWERDILPTVSHLPLAERVAVLFLFHNQGGGFGRSAIARAKKKSATPTLAEIVTAKRFAGGNNPSGIIAVANRVAFMRQFIDAELGAV